MRTAYKLLRVPLPPTTPLSLSKQRICRVVMWCKCVHVNEQEIPTFAKILLDTTLNLGVAFCYKNNVSKGTTIIDRLASVFAYFLFNFNHPVIMPPKIKLSHSRILADMSSVRCKSVTVSCPLGNKTL